MVYKLWGIRWKGIFFLAFLLFMPFESVLHWHGWLQNQQGTRIRKHSHNLVDRTATFIFLFLFLFLGPRHNGPFLDI